MNWIIIISVAGFITLGGFFVAGAALIDHAIKSVQKLND